MNLEFGGGWHSAFINLKRNAVVEYSAATAAAVHEKHGGSQYYHSCSGRSGAGFIPDALHIRPVNTYRVDTRYPEFGEKMIETLPGVRVLHPFVYNGYNTEYPLLIVRDDVVVFCEEFFLPTSAFCEENTEEFSVGFHLPDGDNGQVAKQLHTIKIIKEKDFKARIMRRVLEGMYGDVLRFTDADTDADWFRTRTSWWQNLGLVNAGDYVWKYTNGIIRRAEPLEGLSVEMLQSMVPSNATMLDVDFYVQEEKQIIAHGRQEIDGHEYEYEIELNADDVVEICKGSWQSYRQRCLEGMKTCASGRAIEIAI